MKKAITVTCLLLSALLILDTLNTGHALVMFFLAGIIPGTNIAIDAGRMLEAFALLIGFTLSRVTVYALRTRGVTSHIELDPQSSKGTMLSAQS